MSIDKKYIVLVVLGGCVLICWALSFDSIIRYIHRRRHPLWVSLGSPTGFFFTPSDGLGGVRIRQGLIADMFFGRPSWIISDSTLCKKWRRMTFFAVLGWMMPFALAIENNWQTIYPYFGK